MWMPRKVVPGRNSRLRHRLLGLARTHLDSIKALFAATVPAPDPNSRRRKMKSWSKSRFVRAAEGKIEWIFLRGKPSGGADYTPNSSEESGFA